jgi:hypothetical protein
MCLEDVRLGREKRTAVTQPFLANTFDTYQVLPNESRTGIAFYVANSLIFTVSPQGLPVNPGIGIWAIPSQPPLKFTVEEHGNLVTNGWTVTAVNGNNFPVIVETFLERR